MIWLLKIILFGHAHRWKEDSRTDLHNGRSRIGVRVYCTCHSCGKPAKFDLA